MRKTGRSLAENLGNRKQKLRLETNCEDRGAAQASSAERLGKMAEKCLSLPIQVNFFHKGDAVDLM